MWRYVVERAWPDHEFHDGATEDFLTRAETQLGAALPGDLRALLAETNGVVGPSGLGLVWPVERIAADNLTFRSDFSDVYMPFDALLFFGDAGNGDQFAFTVGDSAGRADIFAWNHENDSRMWVAPELRTYLEWWADGRIEI
jgi:hypothetical protein